MHYAHGKQTFHRDVKPGNILLTLQNGPQLLDFNLAESPHSAEHAQAALHGGTLPYMAPEQIEAFINPDLWNKVEAGADIYSLGLVFRELLTGQKPELPDPSVPPPRALREVLDRRRLLDPSVRGTNPMIPHALEAIVAKCLRIHPQDRYADARALEQDLDRFLKNEPLAHAVNPSRRESVGNWMKRRRRVLVTAVCILVAATAYPVIAALMPPPLEKSPDFAAAVRLFEMGRPATEAVVRFKHFEALDPRSALVKFYLAYALDASLKPDDLQQYDVDPHMRAALAAPDVETSAMGWAKDHPRFTTDLVAFAKSRIRRTDLLAERVDKGGPVSDAERDREVRSSTYQLALNALRLAEKLNAGNQEVQHLLAKTEEHFGLYAQAYERLSRIIDSFSLGTQNDMLFKSHEQRGWVARAWAEKDREARRVDSNTRARLVEAGKDFDYCSRYLENHYFGEYHALKAYYVIQHRLRATVALAEVEVDLAMPGEAEKHLKECRKSAGRLATYIAWKKLSVPPADQFEERIKDAFSRLRSDRDKVSSLLVNRPPAH